MTKEYIAKGGCYRDTLDEMKAKCPTVLSTEEENIKCKYLLLND